MKSGSDKSRYEEHHIPDCLPSIIISFPLQVQQVVKQKLVSAVGREILDQYLQGYGQRDIHNVAKGNLAITKKRQTCTTLHNQSLANIRREAAGYFTTYRIPIYFGNHNNIQYTMVLLKHLV